MKSRKPSQAPSLSPAQRLLFWRVAVSGGQAWVKSIHPPPPPRLRRALEHAGLLVQDQLLDPLTGRAAIRLELTRQGWDWAQENMGGPFANSPIAAETLSLLLEAIAAFLPSAGLRAEDLLIPGRGRTGMAAPDQPGALFDGADDRPDTPSPMIDAGILRQIVTLTSGRTGVPIPLRSLRQLLDIHPLELDEALRRLHREGRIALVTAPHPHAISREDREAAFHDENGNPVHQVKLTGHLDVAY